MTGRPDGASASDPLDRIEARARVQRDGSGLVWDVIANDVLALVAVARAAQEFVNQAEAMEPTFDQWDALREALARLDGAR